MDIDLDTDWWAYDTFPAEDDDDGEGVFWWLRGLFAGVFSAWKYSMIQCVRSGGRLLDWTVLTMAAGYEVMMFSSIIIPQCKYNGGWD